MRARITALERAGRAMPHVGCCGFGMAQDQYFATFGAIEVQQTFYQPPQPGTAGRWREEAPEDFVFTLKAWQCITHYPSSPTYRRASIGEEEKQQCGGFQANDVVLDAWRRTRDIARILDAPFVVFQCPASFDPSEEHVGNMRAFFGEVERDGLMAGWEPRGDEWTDELVRELCGELDLVHVVDPFKRRQVHGDVAYFRLHGRDSYRYQYTHEDLDQLRGMLGGRAGYVMFNNSAMVEDARRFAELIGQ